MNPDHPPRPRRRLAHQLAMAAATSAAVAALGLAALPATAQASPTTTISPDCTLCAYFKPDLTVPYVDLSGTWATIRNDGPRDAAGSWAYIRNNFAHASAVVPVPPLRAGEQVDITVPSSVSADRCNYVVADYYNQIDEITKANNVGFAEDYTTWCP